METLMPKNNKYKQEQQRILNKIELLIPISQPLSALVPLNGQNPFSMPKGISDEAYNAFIKTMILEEELHNLQKIQWLV
jgi:hypothetical protein